MTLTMYELGLIVVKSFVWSSIIFVAYTALIILFILFEPQIRSWITSWRRK